MPFPNPDTQFKPGCPPGPGRPRTKPLTDRLREALEVVGGDGRSMADAVVDQWLTMIADGQIAALRELLDRVEGPLTQALKHDHEGGLTIRVEYADSHGDLAPPSSGATDDLT
jgi:hypothetical protein